MRLRLLLPALLLLLGCTDTPDSVSHGASPDRCCQVTIHASVPPGTGTVYLTGNLPSLGPWQPDARAMEGSGAERLVRITVPRHTAFEYKFTLGSWAREALSPAGQPLANHRLPVEQDAEAAHVIHAFKEDPRVYLERWQESGVQGTLVYWQDVESAFLGPARHVGIWLPPGYAASGDTRYRVLYMHDGQNLFDPRLANMGIWDVDDAVVRLTHEGAIPPLIVVGVFNSTERLAEYSPWHRAPDYARFLLEELMPRVNAEFRTLTGPENTAVMGSSMGGLLSYYLVTNHPEVFGACGCVSTAFPISEAMVARFAPELARGDDPDETPYIIRDIAAGLRVPEGVRYWFDYGTEGADVGYDVPHRAVRRWLLDQGLTEGEDFVVREYPGAYHNEASWRERLADPLRFLFAQNPE